MVTVYDGSITLDYQWTPYGSDPLPVSCSLSLDRTRCNFGGYRPWFICPQCGQRCAVVYFGARGGRYACRKCLRLAYLSEAEDSIGRLWRKQRKLEKRLGENGEKTRGMHSRTYEKLCDQIDGIEASRLAGITLLLARFGYPFK